MTTKEMLAVIGKVPESLRSFWERRYNSGQTLKGLIKETFRIQRKSALQIIGFIVISIVMTMILMVMARPGSDEIIKKYAIGVFVLVVGWFVWMLISKIKYEKRETEIEGLFKCFMAFIQKLVPDKPFEYIKFEELTEASIQQRILNLAKHRIMAAKAFDVTRATPECGAEHVISSAKLLLERSKSLDEAFQIASEAQIVKEDKNEILIKASKMIPRH